MGNGITLDPEKKAKLEKIKQLSEQARMLNYTGVPVVLTLLAQELPFLIDIAENKVS